MRPGRRLHLRLRADNLAVSSKFNPLRLHVCSCESVNPEDHCQAKRSLGMGTRLYVTLGPGHFKMPTH
jgi:hypothetical protein